jgi:hypothetical protein
MDLPGRRRRLGPSGALAWVGPRAVRGSGAGRYALAVRPTKRGRRYLATSARLAPIDKNGEAFSSAPLWTAQSAPAVTQLTPD